MEDIHAPVTQAPPDRPHITIRQIAAALGIIIVLAAVAFAAYWFTSMRPMAVFPKGADVALSIGFVPASELFSLNQKEKVFEQVAPAGAPEGMVAIDRAGDGDARYYLLLDPVSSVANIYRVEGEALIQVTNSNTMKFDLSYDRASGSLVFLSKVLAAPADFLTTKSWDVTVSDAAGMERTIGTGLHAEAVPGKNAVVLATEKGEVSWVSLDTGATAPLITQDQGWVFAVRADGKQLAIYNSAIKGVNIFELDGAPEAMRVSAVLPVPERIASLAFVNDKVVAARPDESQTSTIFSVVGGKATLTVAHPNQSVPSAPYNLSIDL